MMSWSKKSIWSKELIYEKYQGNSTLTLPICVFCCWPFQNSLDPDQPNILSGLIWIQTVGNLMVSLKVFFKSWFWKKNQQMTKHFLVMWESFPGLMQMENVLFKETAMCRRLESNPGLLGKALFWAKVMTTRQSSILMLLECCCEVNW